LQRTRKLFGESVVHLKELAVQLRPPELDVLGISAALRQLFAQTSKRGGTRIRFTETLGRKHVAPAVATTLFRVAQEALTNAIMHGHATAVDVSLKPSNGAITLAVRDRGQGFDPSGRLRASQLGLRVMAEMAAAAGGTLAIASRPGTGTTVRLVLPRPDTRSGP
jgi:signal transduction histidine kinase